MSKKTIGILFIVSIVMGLIGGGLIIAGLAGSTFTTATNIYGGTNNQVQNMANPGLFIAGVAVASLAGIPHLIAWIGALVNLGRLGEWVWFVLVLLFSTIALIVYLIAGPTTPRVAQQYAPRPDYPSQPPRYPQS
ncbi:MAG TPA: hypothetical protein VF458_23895 [Ktedonobacteraceae bacterium]